MKRFHRLLSFMVIISAFGHLAFAFQVYDQLDFNAFWFSSGAMLALLLGLFNLLLNARESLTTNERLIYLLGNGLSSAFIILGFYVMHEIKSGLVALLILLLFITSIFFSKTIGIKK